MRGFPDLPMLMEEELITALRADSTVLSYLGGNTKAIRQLRIFNDILVPSVGIQRIDTLELEIEGLVLVQFHMFHRSVTQARQLRSAVLNVVHNDYHWTVGPLDLFSLYSGGRRHDDPDANVAYLSDDIEYHPYRVLELP